MSNCFIYLIAQKQSTNPCSLLPRTTFKASHSRSPPPCIADFLFGICIYLGRKEKEKETTSKSRTYPQQATILNQYDQLKPAQNAYRVG